MKIKLYILIIIIVIMLTSCGPKIDYNLYREVIDGYYLPENGIISYGEAIELYMSIDFSELTEIPVYSSLLFEEIDSNGNKTRLYSFDVEIIKGERKRENSNLDWCLEANEDNENLKELHIKIYPPELGEYHIASQLFPGLMAGQIIFPTSIPIFLEFYFLVTVTE